VGAPIGVIHVEIGDDELVGRVYAVLATRKLTAVRPV
jgi:hypothetical protein